MLGVPLLPPSRLLALGIFLIAASLAGPAAATCPAGSQFFAYGGAGGCVEPGSNKVVLKCFNMGKVCPTGWSNEGASDTGSWCCPPTSKGETCVWRGTAPICRGRCQAGESTRDWSRNGIGLYTKKHYSDFGATCIDGGKVYCCRG